MLQGMKATLTITSSGAVALQARLRQALGLKPDDQLIAQTAHEGLLLRPAVTLPGEICASGIEAEFDRAEAELARAMASRRDQKSGARSRSQRRP